jgi:glycosyltransferase involved in cell wall biosynthesis
LPPRISLIICTYNRADILPRCLQAAGSQSIPSEDYEIIVVDNASVDHTSSVVKYWPRARYLYCAAPGLSSARNAGVHAARASLVSFIDDDAIADPDLLANLLQTFADQPGAGCVGGRIELLLPPRLPSWFCPEFAGYYSSFDPGGSQPRQLSAMSEYPFGANIAFRKEAIVRAGYFSEKLGRVGRNQSGGEELDLERRLVQMGYEIHYNPNARVQHVILPNRLKWSHIANTAKAAGRNWAYYEVELGYRPASFRCDCRMLAASLAGVPSPKTGILAYSQTLFYSAKILRKVRYIGKGGLGYPEKK